MNPSSQRLVRTEYSFYAWRKRLRGEGPVRFALVDRGAMRQEPAWSCDWKWNTPHTRPSARNLVSKLVLALTVVLVNADPFEMMEVTLHRHLLI